MKHIMIHQPQVNSKITLLNIPVILLNIYIYFFHNQGKQKGKPITVFNVHGSLHRNNILIYIQQDATLHSSFFIWKLPYMFRVVPPPTIRSANNCTYSIWYLSHRYCYLPLSWKSWNRFECAVGGVRHGVTNTRCCRYSCLRS